MAAVVVGALLLAGGGKKVTVPEVVGVDEPSARAALTREGFDVESSRRSDDKPRGTVIGQDPSGGSKAEEGSTVQITVSDGPATVRVPPVEGLTYESARDRLEKAGFKVEPPGRRVGHGRARPRRLLHAAGGDGGRPRRDGRARRLLRAPRR